MPSVSIIIPTCNRPQLLPRAVESARAAGTEVEIIVVDDASQDETAAVCARLAGIKYIRLDRNQGVAGARNVGILASSAEFVAFLDDDDLRLPGSLDSQVATLAAAPKAGFVCGAMLLANQNYRLTGEVSAPPEKDGDVFWQLLELDFPVMPLSLVIRKQCFLSVGLLNRRLQGIDDWDILVRIAELFPVITSSQPVGVYRQPAPWSGQGSSMQSGQLARAANHQLQLFKLPRVKALSQSQRRAIRRRTINRVADTLLFSAWKSLAQKEFGFAAANVTTALRLNPFRALRPAVVRRMGKTLSERLSAKNSNPGGLKSPIA
ncbi:MAG TPA: glycosyltransferase [Pyrinomonadaceae bacterium]|nr:glycosyltransferase [Pyrinomonadaceae bacterium]